MSSKLFNLLPISLKLTYIDLKETGWTIQVRDFTRGFCCFRRKLVIIPAWAIKRDLKEPGYLIYYTAHEFAHCFAGSKAKHGPAFMAVFKDICPTEFQHWEFEYKPKNAILAGVSIDPDLL